MASTYSDKLRFELIATGEQSGTWGSTTNVNLGTLIEAAIAGVANVVMADANYTLTANNGTADEARCAVLLVTSSTPLTAQRNLVCPTKSKVYIVRNGTDGAQTIQIKTAVGTGVNIPNGKTTFVYCDGTNITDAIDHLSATAFGFTGAISAPSLALTTPLPLASGGTGSTTAAAACTAITGFAAGTRLVFQQTSAPTGWTKETSSTYDNAALRFTTSTVGTGGADGFNTFFGTGKTTAGYTLQIADMPSHGHTANVTDPGHDHDYTMKSITGGFAGGGDPLNLGTATYQTTWEATGISVSIVNTGGGGAHAHTLNNFNIKFADCIIAQKA